MQRKIIRLLCRHQVDAYFEYLAGPLSGFENRVHDQNSFRPAWHKRQVEKDVTDAGADVECGNFRRQIEMRKQMLNYRRPETVVPDENVSATEY
jgi:hypothetical protein